MTEFRAAAGDGQARARPRAGGARTVSPRATISIAINGVFSRPEHKLAGQSYVGRDPGAGRGEGRRRHRVDAARDGGARRDAGGAGAQPGQPDHGAGRGARRLHHDVRVSTSTSPPWCRTARWWRWIRESDPPCLQVAAGGMTARWGGRVMPPPPNPLPQGEGGSCATSRSIPAQAGDLLPGITSALSYSAADILGKVVFNDGMDVLSFVTTRGVLTALFFLFWLRGAPPARRHTRRERLISIGIGADVRRATCSACCWRFSCCRCRSRS